MNAAVEGVQSAVRGSISIVQKDVGQLLPGRTESLRSDPFLYGGFVQLLQDGSIPVPIRSTNPVWLSTKIGHNNKRSSL